MNNNICLNKLKSGQKAIIKQYLTEEFPAKFYELGLSPETIIEVKHKAPFDGPICMNILNKNQLVAIRTSEAKNILVLQLI